MKIQTWTGQNMDEVGVIYLETIEGVEFKVEDQHDGSLKITARKGGGMVIHPVSANQIVLSGQED